MNVASFCIFISSFQHTSVNVDAKLLGGYQQELGMQPCVITGICVHLIFIKAEAVRTILKALSLALRLIIGRET